MHPGLVNAATRSILQLQKWGMLVQPSLDLKTDETKPRSPLTVIADGLEALRAQVQYLHQRVGTLETTLGLTKKIPTTKKLAALIHYDLANDPYNPGRLRKFLFDTYARDNNRSNIASAVVLAYTIGDEGLAINPYDYFQTALLPLVQRPLEQGLLIETINQLSGNDPCYPQTIDRTNFACSEYEPYTQVQKDMVAANAKLLAATAIDLYTSQKEMVLPRPDSNQLKKLSVDELARVLWNIHRFKFPSKDVSPNEIHK